MILQALELTAERNVRDFATITVLFNPDEEIGSRGSADLIARQAHQILALQALGDSAKGTTVDWTRIRPGESPNVIPIRGSLPVSLILAGGLDASNVGRAIEQVQPFGVDVNSGVKGSDGFKDPASLQTFIAAVRHKDFTH
ncbi:hypothetical protein VB716_04290 [Synechococcus sp. CCY9201]|uniref:phosphoribosylanthranilate isomerase n=1 Tax=Synechococcus sp. CCY9201 TaxID=174697 RepID=UPI002B21ABF5|nr:hypothetical protein [Synechococcus sp. CCY9201]MEA5473435.1 hypothetical protein [Synechococcus sp. CCY9201]